MLGGCHNRRRPVAADPSAPATAGVLAQVRSHARLADPSAKVGLVTEADAKNMLVAVGDINASDFQTGQNVSFVDSRENPLTSGTIIRILSGSIHVRYDRPTAGRRPPRQGDIMIQFKPAF
jgi:hypothetical protein